jgi:three-Cys-motif partner protein
LPREGQVCRVKLPLIGRKEKYVNKYLYFLPISVDIAELFFYTPDRTVFERFVMEYRDGGEKFFNKQTHESWRKAYLFHEYFKMWSSVIKNTLKRSNIDNYKICYVDLYCGQGVYEDGKESTPMLIMKSILSDPELYQHTMTFFNDKNSDVLDKLKNNFETLDNYNKLRYTPKYSAEEVDADIVHALNTGVPSLIVLDPFGYKGVTLELIKGTTRDFGNDLILFFNLNSIVRAIPNDFMQQNMALLFGDRYRELMHILATMEKVEESQAKLQYENEIIKTLHTALTDVGIPYMMKYRIANSDEVQALRYLLFISKNSKGCKAFKTTLKNFSRTNLYDCFGYSSNLDYKPLLEEFEADRLSSELANQYCGKRVLSDDIKLDYACRCFVDADITKALSILEEKGEITVDDFKKDGKKRRKGYFADGTIINFYEVKNG